MTHEPVREWTWTEWSGYTSKKIDTGVHILWEGGEADYDWEHFALLRREHGDGFQYASYVDSGCSCNEPFEDDPDTYAFEWHYTPVQPAIELKKAVRENSSITAQEKAEMLSELSRF